MQRPFLWPFFDWFLATHRRSIALLYKHQVHSIKILNTGQAETVKKFWTMNTQNLSSLQVFQSFCKCKNLFLQSCPKECIRFLCECIINLLTRNLQSIKRHHVAKFHSEVRLLSLKRSLWKQTRDILASEKGLQLNKVITLPVINHLSCYGAVWPRSCFCVQQEIDYPASYKAGTSKVLTFTKSHVLNWVTQEREKQKIIFQSRLFSRQKFVFSTFQALRFTNYNFGCCRNWNVPNRHCSTTAS